MHAVRVSKSSPIPAPLLPTSLPPHSHARARLATHKLPSQTAFAPVSMNVECNFHALWGLMGTRSPSQQPHQLQHHTCSVPSKASHVPAVPKSVLGVSMLIGHSYKPAYYRPMPDASPSGHGTRQQRYTHMRTRTCAAPCPKSQSRLPPRANTQTHLPSRTTTQMQTHAPAAPCPAPSGPGHGPLLGCRCGPSQSTCAPARPHHINPAHPFP